MRDVAELSNVPLKQLARILRLVATVGFFQEPEPNFVSHTSLSASFVANPALHDAAMFLAESAAPAALQAATVARSFEDTRVNDGTAFSLAMNNRATPFLALKAQNPKLSRQWAAFLQYSAGVPSSQDIVQALAQLNWGNVANAGGEVVEVGSDMHSLTSIILRTRLRNEWLVVLTNWEQIGVCHITPLLARIYPKLHFVVQQTEPTFNDSANGPNNQPQITLTSRVLGTQQIRTGAAVYVLHPPSSLTELHAELQVHLSLLRIRNSSMILVTTKVLPETESAEPFPNAAIARARDLTLHQMANEEELEMPALRDTIDTVRDAAGKMMVVHTLRSRIGVIVALVIKYQLFTATDL
ncbi:hypothetical protein NQ176_g2602 [Zarea fungicola]|uniref:Uncharacterized protein n=1 Tax=Zarea fungicola TaxID=93591 RepID=A0ACC1NNV8_9HYPO|nr:hypothetical protein NQ176_g2602 [Lecanicillium fungicola]